MAKKRFENYEERSIIISKIENCNKYQWLVFIPLWAVTILQMIFPVKTIPVPENYILFLDVAVLLFSVIGFVAVRLQMRKLKEKLVQL